MTQLGRLQREFYNFREEVLSRLEALEASKGIDASESTGKTPLKSKNKKNAEGNEMIILETKENDIIGTEVPFEFK